MPLKLNGCSEIELIPSDSGRVAGSTLDNHQSIKGLICRDKQPLTLTFATMGNLVPLINLPPCLWTVGRKPEHPDESLVGTRRTCKLLKERPRWVFAERFFFPLTGFKSLRDKYLMLSTSATIST